MTTELIAARRMHISAGHGIAKMRAREIAKLRNPAQRAPQRVTTARRASHTVTKLRAPARARVASRARYDSAARN